ncbi:MAG: hypothetical protein FWD62_04530 [Betaproteobacteria bacterium]|nr:hypothetical protein [Betaproteobacteria bacterium]
MTDVFKAAAGHLRQEAEQNLGVRIGSGQAHNLVAAALGYKSAAALRADFRSCCDDPWLGQKPANVSAIANLITRMQEPAVTPSQAALIGEIVLDGLTPACAICGTMDRTNFPLGNVEPGDTRKEHEWTCRTCAKNDNGLDVCHCCGPIVIFRVEDIDDKGLCEMHKGEFDFDLDEERDAESLIEYWENH